MSLSNRSELEFLKQRKWHRALAALFDVVALILAWLATVDLRLLINPLMTRHLTRSTLIANAPSYAALLLLWIGVAVWLRLYSLHRGRRPGGHMRSVMNATLLLSAVLIAYVFFSRQIGADGISRSFVLLFAPTSFFMLMIANYSLLVASIVIARRFGFEERVAVAGDGPHAEYLVEQLTRYGGGSSRVVGFILPRASEGRLLGNTPVLGTTATVAEVINTARLDRIIVANGSLPEDEATACVRTARRMGVITGHALAGVMEEDLGGALLRIGRGMAIVEVHPRTYDRKQEFIKRLLDVCLSAAILVLVLPVLVVLGILVRLTSPGPVFYVSNRVGKGGRHFRFFKFRTMYSGADALREHAGVNEVGGHLFKIRSDPRVTPIGRFMRRYSLVELPQLFNVLAGNMSLVGPRPLPARDLEPDGCSRRFATWARERIEAMPGITCLWQIRGRSDLPFDRMMELDLEYIRNWSLALDLEILLETPLAVLSGRGAY